MKAVFLSASVPVPGRGSYFEDSDPFLIQAAVRELVIAVIARRRLVWGGHPAITPMIWAICEDLGVEYANAVVLYQSRLFEEVFPQENARFKNVHYVEAVDGDRGASLSKMRYEMMSRSDYSAGVFIGGMEGVEAEFDLFREVHPDLPTVVVASPGGAARRLARRSTGTVVSEVDDIDFAGLYRRVDGIALRGDRDADEEATS